MIKFSHQNFVISGNLLCYYKIQMIIKSYECEVSFNRHSYQIYVYIYIYIYIYIVWIKLDII